MGDVYDLQFKFIVIGKPWSTECLFENDTQLHF